MPYRVSVTGWKHKPMRGMRMTKTYKTKAAAKKAVKKAREDLKIAGVGLGYLRISVYEVKKRRKR